MGNNIIIGFPRSGNHCVNIFLEYYFNVKCSPSWNGEECSVLINQQMPLQDNFWISAHDIYSNVKINKDDNLVYIYRDPRYVIFSYLMAYRLGAKIPDASFNKYLIDLSEDNFINWCIQRLNDHYDKYLNNNVLLIHYEKIKLNFLSELEKIVNLFGKPWDCEKARLLYNSLTKRQIIDIIGNLNNFASSYFNADMLNEVYEIKRQIFLDKWGLYINKRLVNLTHREKFFHIDYLF